MGPPAGHSRFGHNSGNYWCDDLINANFAPFVVQLLGSESEKVVRWSGTRREGRRGLRGMMFVVGGSSDLVMSVGPEDTVGLRGLTSRLLSGK